MDTKCFAHNDSISCLVYASSVLFFAAEAGERSVVSGGLRLGGSAVAWWDGISSLPMMNLIQTEEKLPEGCSLNTTSPNRSNSLQRREGESFKAVFIPAASQDTS